jgi:hypothetical protein
MGEFELLIGATLSFTNTATKSACQPPVPGKKEDRVRQYNGSERSSNLFC